MIIDDPGLALRKMFVYGAVIAIYVAVIVVSAFTCFGLPIAILSILLFIVQYYYSDRLLLRATGARTVDRGEVPELYAMMESISAKMGVAPPRIALIANSVPNAFATGRNEHNAVIVYTTGLLERLDYEEIRAVTAHEMSHIRNRDMFVVIFAGFTITMLSWAVYMLLHSLFSRKRRSAMADKVAGVVSWFLSATIGVILVSTVSRYREYNADINAALVTGNPNALISALKKITMASEREVGTPEMSHAKAVLTSTASRAITELFATHPPLKKRIIVIERVRDRMLATAAIKGVNGNGMR